MKNNINNTQSKPVIERCFQEMNILCHNSINRSVNFINPDFFVFSVFKTKSMKMKSIQFKKSFYLLALLIFISMSASSQISTNWKETLNDQIQLHGHRNWILVVDAAYPYQSNPAIKTIVTGAGHLEVVEEVLTAIEKANHVFAEVYLDKELEFLPNAEVRGINGYRRKLERLLKGKNVEKVLHEEMISKIDKDAEVFNILVLKTNFTLPYTSVFINLNCGYWSTEQEKKLRELMPD